MPQASADLAWLVVRGFNAHQVKRNTGGVPILSNEIGNLRNVHSKKYSGFANHKVVSVTAAPKGRGIVVKTRKAKSDASAASKATSTQILRASSGSRKAAKNVAQIVGSYRPDLTKAAVSRASVLLRCQQASVSNKSNRSIKQSKKRGVAKRAVA